METNAVSPLKEARLRLGLSLAELAIASRCELTAVSRAEHGGRLPGRVVSFLAEVGCDGESLKRQHQAYQEKLGAAIRARLKGQAGRQ